MLAFLLAGTVAMSAQGAPPSIRLAIGFGVDTTGTPNHEIIALYRNYLAHWQDQPSPYWSRREQAQWVGFDLLRPSIFQGFTNFTLLHLAPAVGQDSTYLIRALVTAVDDSTKAVRPLAVYRVYAVREEGRWVLGNALPRVTRHWSRATIGRVTFAFPPGRDFDRGRAEASAKFVDSLAQAFHVPPPTNIDYYFTDNLVDTFAAMGLDFFPLGGETVGGRAYAPNRLVFVASARNGEDYLHELAHVVLWPFLSDARTHGSVIEGLMTFVGGSAGLSYAELLPGLRAYVAAHPELTLETVLTNPPPRQGTLDVGYNGMAVLCAMIHDKGGLPALREFVNTGAQPAEILAGAARLLGVPRERLDRLWHGRVTSAGR